MVKTFLAIVIIMGWLNQVQAQLLPKCLIQKISVGYDYSQIRVALFKKDMCYVIDRRTWDPSKISRHEIFMITSKRKLPEYVQPEVYNKDCKPLKFLKNKDLNYTPKVYSWTEIDRLIKNN